MHHVIVARESGMFCGWPANNGIWSWDREILLGYKKGTYAPHDNAHSIDRTKPQVRWLVRSLDAGESWSQELPEEYNQDAPRRFVEEIRFDNPDFALRSNGNTYRYSYDRGRSWHGPFAFPTFGIAGDLTARTDYLVTGSHRCQFFLSAKEPRVEADLQDRSFCAVTEDGGKSFRFQSWMTAEPIEARSVMSSTVRISDSRLLSALRRRRDETTNGAKIRRCWIDLYASDDDGENWFYVSKCTDTDTPEEPHNGNPPSLIRHPDGRIAVVYGYRATTCGMCVRISHDEGRTWGVQKYLRNDARSWDIGYPKSVLLPDAGVFTAYYYTTEKEPEQHIAGTVWYFDELE